MKKRIKELEGVFIHPKAIVETDQIGEGTRVWAFGHILKGEKIGEIAIYVITLL